MIAQLRRITAFIGKIRAQDKSNRYPTTFDPTIEPSLPQIKEMPRADDLQ
jgi:hypothetical protein